MEHIGSHKRAHTNSLHTDFVWDQPNVIVKSPNHPLHDRVPFSFQYFNLKHAPLTAWS